MYNSWTPTMDVWLGGWVDGWMDGSEIDIDSWI